MEELAILIDNDETRQRINHRPEGFTSGKALVVTDRLGTALHSEATVAFIASDLTSMLRLLDSREVAGILSSQDVSDEQLVALARGSRVFSVFTAKDLGLSDAHYQVVRSAATGLTIQQTAEASGYSERHTRRILNRLCSEAEIDPSFPWPILSPIFET